jgi:hypothetical protein
MRNIESRYQDPVEIIWLRAAQDCGIEVKRDAEVFASWDGNGVLRIGTDETLDPDDSLAQMIFHEMCHALVEGPNALEKPDWGLEYGKPDHEVREHACLRLQAALADEFGLRKIFAATTDYREYFDRIPADALRGDDDAAVELAKKGMIRAKEGPWANAIHDALQETTSIRNIVKERADEDSIWL